MSRLIFDASGSHKFETGVSNGVLYVWDGSAQTPGYQTGVAWNGLVSVSENPEGGELTPIYADDIKYLNLRSAEDFKATIEAYTYPDAFAACQGEVALASGLTIGQQPRSTFCFCYKTKVGNDLNPEAGYKIHIIYGCSVSPSERSHETINDSPEAMTMSWEVATTPVAVADHKPCAHIVIDSTVVAAAKMTTIENNLYGKDATTDPQSQAINPHVLMPDEILAIISAQ